MLRLLLLLVWMRALDMRMALRVRGRQIRRPGISVFGSMLEVTFRLRMLTAGFDRKLIGVIDLRMLAVGHARLQTRQLGLTSWPNRLPSFSGNTAVPGKYAGLGSGGYSRCAVIDRGE